MQAPDAVPNAVPEALPLRRNGLEGSAWAPWSDWSSGIRLGPLVRMVVIHPDKDVDQAKGATADAVTGRHRPAGTDLPLPVRLPL